MPTGTGLTGPLTKAHWRIVMISGPAAWRKVAARQSNSAPPT